MLVKQQFMPQERQILHVDMDSFLLGRKPHPTPLFCWIKSTEGNRFCLKDRQVKELAQTAMQVEKLAGLIIKNLSLGSHAASVLRELKLPTLIKPRGKLRPLAEKFCTMDTSSSPAKVFRGKLPVEQKRIHYSGLPRPQTKIFVGCSFPSTLYRLYRAPIDGIGLIRSVACRKMGKNQAKNRAGRHYAGQDWDALPVRFWRISEEFISLSKD